MTRALLGCLALVPLLALAEGPAAARVNGVLIPAQRVQHWAEDRLAASGRNFHAIRSPAALKRALREALEELIDDELLWQEAQRRDTVAPPRDVEAELAAIRSRFATPDAYRRRLEAAGFTDEGHAEHLRRRLSIERLLRDEAQRGGEAAGLVARLRSAAKIEIAGGT